jgi:hypothetical protein
MTPIDYHNPNDPWMHDPYKGLTDEERIGAGCFHIVLMMIGALTALILCALFTGCSSPRTVTNTSDHRVDDKLERIDSLLTNRTVIQQDSVWHESVMRQFQSIRERSDTNRTTVVDTAGNIIREKIIINNIRETNSETDKTEREVLIRRFEKMDSTISKMIERQEHTDSLLQSKETVKEVPAKLTWWQQLRIHLGGITFWLLMAALVWFIGGKLQFIRKFLP